MQKDERDLLEVLKFELQFLEDGGYGRSPRTPWRPQYIFEDSLTCMNYDSKENPGPCGDCVLPPHSVQHIGGDSGFPLPVQQPTRDRRNGWSLAEGHYSTFGRRTGSGSTS